MHKFLLGKCDENTFIIIKTQIFAWIVKKTFSVEYYSIVSYISLSIRVSIVQTD